MSALARRTITIPGYFFAFALLVALAPAALALALAIDLVRGRQSSLARAYVMIAAFFSCEMLGLARAFWVWLTGGARDLDRNFRLQWWWNAMIFGVARRAFSMSVEIDGLEHMERGPVLFMLRHASVGDTLLAAALVSPRTSMRLRYVLKRELTWDPCLDVVGHRLPNAFVERGSMNPERERALVADLARALGPHDGVLIYPEGTRFSQRGRAAAIAALEASDPALAARARSLTHVLPPKLGGPLALLDAAPGVDVVFGAHVGFDGVRRLSDLANGALLGRTIRLSMRRVSAAEIPTNRDARIAWLYDEWGKVDAFVGRHREQGS